MSTSNIRKSEQNNKSTKKRVKIALTAVSLHAEIRRRDLSNDEIDLAGLKNRLIELGTESSCLEILFRLGNRADFVTTFKFATMQNVHSITSLINFKNIINPYYLVGSSLFLYELTLFNTKNSNHSRMKAKRIYTYSSKGKKI